MVGLLHFSNRIADRLNSVGQTPVRRKTPWRPHANQSVKVAIEEIKDTFCS